MSTFYRMPVPVLIERELADIKTGDRIRLALGEVIMVDAITKGLYDGEYQLVYRVSGKASKQQTAIFNEPLTFDVEVY